MGGERVSHGSTAKHWPRRCRVFVLASLIGIPTPAAAQDIAAAEALFNRGMADLEAGRYETACKAIAESQRLDPRPGTLFTLATCEERWGRIATAVTRYGDYLALYERLPEARKAAQGERPKVAKAQRERLAAEVPELTLSLPPEAPAGTVVKRDGQVVAAAALGLALPVDPGEHTVTTEAPGGGIWEQRITLSRREKKKMTLEVRAGLRAEPRPVPAPSPVAQAVPATPLAGHAEPGQRRVAAYVVGGVGLAALGAGIGFAVDYAKARSTVTSDCPGGVCDPRTYDLTRMQALRGRWNRDLGLFLGLGAVGLGGVGAGAAILVQSPRTERPAAPAAFAPWLAPGAAGGVWTGSF